VIAKKGDMLHIITKDVRGSSELVLPIDGGPVAGEGDNRVPVNYRAFREGGALVSISYIYIYDILTSAPPSLKAR